MLTEGRRAYPTTIDQLVLTWKLRLCVEGSVQRFSCTIGCGSGHRAPPSPGCPVGGADAARATWVPSSGAPAARPASRRNRRRLLTGELTLTASGIDHAQELTWNRTVQRTMPVISADDYPT